MAELPSDPREPSSEPEPEMIDEDDDQPDGHKDPHRAAQATLARTAGPEGADPADNMATEPPGDDERA